MLKPTLTALLCTAAMAGAALDAQASDRKYLPGAVCQPVEGSHQDIDYNSSGEVRNDSSTLRRTVSCPMIHDDTSFADYSVTISVWDGHDVQAVECFAKSITLGAPSLVSSSSDASAGMGRDSLAISVNTSTTGAYFHVTCDLPPQGSTGKAHITSFNYVEF